MKKIFTLLTIVLFGVSAMAELPINIGIHGGVSSNRIKIKDLPNAIGTKAHTGYRMGAFCRINLGTIYLEPSLDFVQKKSVVELFNGEQSTLKINSFDIPILLGVKILDFSIVKLRGFIGPVVSFPGKIKGIPSVLTSDGLDSKNATWNAKIGAGVDLWKLTFDIDYEKSFQKLGHELKAPRSFNFTLGFKII